MSSTDGSRTAKAHHAAVRAFFDKELMPLAARLKAEGRPMFPTGPDPTLPTYFKTRARTSMAREDFFVPGLESPAAFSQAIGTLWERSALPEMGALAPSMGRLAEALRGQPEQDEEVSPFIYVMF